MAPGSAKAKQISSTFLDQESRAQKYRYGAWYLPKHLWQRSLTNEELRDPKIIKAEREDTTRKRDEQIVNYFPLFPPSFNSNSFLECSPGSITWRSSIQRIFTRKKYSSSTKSTFLK
jgi:hypothetical protein